MFWLRTKKNNFQILTLIWRPGLSSCLCVFFRNIQYIQFRNIFYFLLVFLKMCNDFSEVNTLIMFIIFILLRDFPTFLKTGPGP